MDTIEPSLIKGQRKREISTTPSSYKTEVKGKGCHALLKHISLYKFV